MIPNFCYHRVFRAILKSPFSKNVSFFILLRDPILIFVVQSRVSEFLPRELSGFNRKKTQTRRLLSPSASLSFSCTSPSAAVAARRCGGHSPLPPLPHGGSSQSSTGRRASAFVRRVSMAIPTLTADPVPFSAVWQAFLDYFLCVSLSCLQYMDFQAWTGLDLYDIRNFLNTSKRKISYLNDAAIEFRWFVELQKLAYMFDIWDIEICESSNLQKEKQSNDLTSTHQLHVVSHRLYAQIRLFFLTNLLLAMVEIHWKGPRGLFV